MKYLLNGDTLPLKDGLSQTRYTALKLILENEQHLALLFSVYAKYEDETLARIQGNLKKFVLHLDENGESLYRSSVLVSHSQGNLFFNQMYDQLVIESETPGAYKIPADYWKNSFGNFQVGSAAIESNSPISEYHTAGNDSVVQGILPLGFPVRPPDFWVIRGSGDPKNHSFVDTYTKKFGGIVYDEDIYKTYIESNIINENSVYSIGDRFYEKLNALAEQVLREPEPIVLNTSKLCLDDNKVDFQIGVSDNFISIELGSVILNEAGIELSRTVTKEYEKLSELPNPIISERTKMAHFDHTHSSRTKNEHFFVKACTRTECREEQFSVEHPEYKLTYSEDDEEQLDNANLISSGGLDGVIRKEQRTKFEVVGTPGGYTLFPAYYVGCYIGNVGFDENGNYIKGVGAHFFDYGIYDMIRADLITSAEDTIDIIFTSDNKNCEDKEKYVEKRFTVVRPACEYELKKAAELNAANQ